MVIGVGFCPNPSNQVTCQQHVCPPGSWPVNLVYLHPCFNFLSGSVIAKPDNSALSTFFLSAGLFNIFKVLEIYL